MLLRPALRCAA